LKASNKFIDKNNNEKLYQINENIYSTCKSMQIIRFLYRQTLQQQLGKKNHQSTDNSRQIRDPSWVITVTFSFNYLKRNA